MERLHRVLVLGGSFVSATEAAAVPAFDRDTFNGHSVVACVRQPAGRSVIHDSSEARHLCLTNLQQYKRSREAPWLRFPRWLELT